MKQLVIDCIEAETKAMDLLKAEFADLKSMVCKLLNLEPKGDQVKDKEDPKPIGPTVPLPPPPPPPPT